MRYIVLLLCIGLILGIVGHIEYHDQVQMQQAQQFDPHYLSN